MFFEIDMAAAGNLAATIETMQIEIMKASEREKEDFMVRYILRFQ